MLVRFEMDRRFEKESERFIEMTKSHHPIFFRIKLEDLREYIIKLEEEINLLKYDGSIAWLFIGPTLFIRIHVSKTIFLNF